MATLPPASPAPTAFSLIGGGPLHRLLQRLHVVRGDGRDFRRMAVLFAATTWVPLIAMAMPAIAMGRLPPLLADLSLHARLLLAGPLLCAAEASLQMRTARCIDRLVAGHSTEEIDSAIARLTAAALRARNAVAPEVVWLGLAVAGSQLLLWGVDESLGLARGKHLDNRSSPLALWYFVVALPAFQFLVYRWLWRWGIWSWLLWRLSRLRLRAMATHPDLRGGLAFLSEPAVGFGLVILAASIVQAAIWGDQVLFAQVDVTAFKSHLAVLLVLSLLVAFGPLLAFTAILQRARFDTLRQYDRLALDYTRLFHARWIERGERDGLLGAPDIQSLADLTSACDVVRGMRLVPVGRRDLAIVGIAVVAPMLPPDHAAAAPPRADPPARPGRPGRPSRLASATRRRS